MALAKVVVFDSSFFRDNGKRKLKTLFLHLEREKKREHI